MTSSYGDTFASVYDRWYPDDGRAAAVVAGLGAPPPGARLLELGVGTGTLAVPLAEAGWEVIGLDNSAAMLARLAARRGREPKGRLAAHRGEAGDPATWPEGPFEVVLAAWNLIANLLADAELEGLFVGAAAAIGPRGSLVVEADVPALPPRRERRLALATVATGAVRVHTDVDPRSGTVSGCHVVHRFGQVRRRPWTIRLRDPAHLDRAAAGAGLAVGRRVAAWNGARFAEGQDRRHVTWYRRAQSSPGG